MGEPEVERVRWHGAGPCEVVSRAKRHGYVEIRFPDGIHTTIPIDEVTPWVEEWTPDEERLWCPTHGYVLRGIHNPYCHETELRPVARGPVIHKHVFASRCIGCGALDMEGS
jgi:hypothetical protein